MSRASSITFETESGSSATQPNQSPLAVKNKNNFKIHYSWKSETSLDIEFV